MCVVIKCVSCSQTHTQCVCPLLTPVQHVQYPLLLLRSLQSCYVHSCGFDSGDCGVDKFDQLYHIALQPHSMNHSIPLGVKAMYFNLTSVFGNGTTVTKATYTKSPVIRTAVVSQKYKVLTFTFVKNVSLSSAQVFLEGKNSTGNNTLVSTCGGQRTPHLHVEVKGHHHTYTTCGGHMTPHLHVEVKGHHHTNTTCGGYMTPHLHVEVKGHHHTHLRGNLSQ